MGKVSGGAGRRRIVVLGRQSGSVNARVNQAEIILAEARRMGVIPRLEQQDLDREVPVGETATSRLTASRSYTTGSGKAVYRFETSGRNEVSLEIGEYGNVDLRINDRGSSAHQSMPVAEARAISDRVTRHLAENAKTKRDGFQYTVVASHNFADEPMRAIQYETAGFTRPYNASVGEVGGQYGIVKDGRIIPDTGKLARIEGQRYAANNEKWQQTRNR